MSAHVPPGWPREVHPPDTDGFTRTASAWLLDLCPPDYRAHDVLVRHPLVLAVLAGHHVAAQAQGQRRAVATLRTDLAAAVGVDVVERALDVLDAEQARLAAASRGVALVAEALRGVRRPPRL
ncbi:hypothetical protein [Quadrisphaera granulorum]|uniref:hypothetical protein n=1 Tax=Quadrisphaera granulorum TaxID=317664 RepID=UPI000D6B68E1|nr:hypothetical protein [Quadrisphaera granulorum]